MTQEKTVLLNKEEIKEKINRLSIQLYEDFLDDKNIILAGVGNNGFELAKKIAAQFESLSGKKTILVQVRLDKKNPSVKIPELNPVPEKLKDSSVALIDDVLDSGRTLIYSMRPFLDAGVRKLRTVVLANRSHALFPVAADFTGISVATTLQEHITVVLEKNNESVFLE